MPLTDPELDLLLEMLADDPSAPVYVQVGEDLVRRGRWAEASRVLWAGLGQGRPEARGYELLARAALEAGQYELAHLALVEVDRDPVTSPELARVEILVLERSGRLDAARTQAERYLAHDKNDVVVSSVMERLQAPPPKANQRAADPFFTVARAERYVDIGRADRAVRVFRRILLANVGSAPLELRMRQLMSAPANIHDDLSAELTDPGLVPELPDANPGPIDMPPPTMATPAAPPGRVSAPGRSAHLGDSDTVDTDVPARTRHHAPLPTPEIEDEENTERVDVFAALKRYAQGGFDTDEDSEGNSDDPDFRSDGNDPKGRKRRSLIDR